MGRQSRGKAEARAARPRREIAAFASRLAEYEAELPKLTDRGIWAAIDLLVAEQPEGLGWPTLCVVPSVAVQGIVSKARRDSVERVHILGSLTHSIYCWRLGRGIYRFDTDVAGTLLDTPLESEIPDALFLRLPEWCCYLVAPDHDGWPKDVLGVFVTLDWNRDAKDGPRAELRMLFETEADGKPDLGLGIVPLGYGTLGACLQAWEDSVFSRPENQDALEDVQLLLDAQKDRVRRSIGLVLYLLTVNADVVVDGSTSRPGRRPPSAGPSRKTRMVDVGFRVGPLIRERRQQTAAIGSGRSVAPHLRRAHWHHYWTKPTENGEPELALRWIMPTFVGGRPTQARVRDVNRRRSEGHL